MRMPALRATALAIAIGCIGKEGDTNRRATSIFTATPEPVAIVTAVGADTLSDSAQIHQLKPEPDGQSIAFLFTDPAKGVSRGLGLVQTKGNQPAQLVWPDSVLSLWWGSPHQLSFTAGTGQGVRVVLDAHAAQLKALEPAAATHPGTSDRERPAKETTTKALARVQEFIDSVRVQPEGVPQRSALQYRADSILIGPGDSIAAAHVSATGTQDSRSNPAWYIVHLPTGQVRSLDSLVGQSPELAAAAGGWSEDGIFYYAKGRSIWRVRPSAF
jgi:hypothetical protein